MVAYKLSDTSALVTMLAGPDIHTSGYAVRYLKNLDLDAGNYLLKMCRGVWPHVDHLVKNRKKCILDGTIGCVREGTDQIVIMGSGVDPLSLEVASVAKDVRIFEVDYEQMDIKRRLVQETVPEIDGQISFITADLSSPDTVMEKISAAGWNSSKPTVVVLEGISYYLNQDRMWNLIRRLGQDAPNDIILEYMVPSELIVPERAHIPDRIFGIIRNMVGNMEISRFGPDTVKGRVADMGGRILERHTMQTIEKSRTGSNRLFPTEVSGWIEVCHIRTSPQVTA